MGCEIKNAAQKRILVGSVVVAIVAGVLTTGGCVSEVEVSGHEGDASGCVGARGGDRYDGCFWNDRLWEDNWLAKKDTMRTLKIARVRIAPWQSIIAVATLGMWVPTYVEWELNGDGK